MEGCMRLVVWGDIKTAGGHAYSAEIVRLGRAAADRTALGVVAGDALKQGQTRSDGEPEYLSYADLVQRTGVSERAWRRALEDPVDPLPCYRIGGRTLFKRVEWEAWMQRRRAVGAPELDEIVVRAALERIRR
jgi:hypothetical protein